MPMQQQFVHNSGGRTHTSQYFQSNRGGGGGTGGTGGPNNQTQQTNTTRMLPPLNQNQPPQQHNRHQPQPQTNQQLPYHHHQPPHIFLPQNSSGIFLPTGAQIIYSRPNVLPQAYGGGAVYHPMPYNSSYAQQQPMQPFMYYNQQNMVVSARGGPTAAAAIPVQPPPTQAAPAANTAPISLLPQQLMTNQNQFPATVPGSYERNMPRKGRRPNALQIIDPDTGIDKLNEILEEEQHSHSGDSSSARQTPQPQPNNNNKEVKEVQATFAKMVAQAINSDEKPSEEVSQNKHQHHHPHQQPNLQDSTPIVSANSDSTAEVIFLKDRGESPITKAKKQQLNAGATAALEQKNEILKEPILIKEEVQLSASPAAVFKPTAVAAAPANIASSAPSATAAAAAAVTRSPPLLPPIVVKEELKEVIVAKKSLQVNDVQTSLPSNAKLEVIIAETQTVTVVTPPQQLQQKLPDTSSDVPISATATGTTTAAAATTVSTSGGGKSAKSNQKNKAQPIKGQSSAYQASSQSTATVAQAVATPASTATTSNVVIPQPQPKSTSKANKSKKELNMKGASKEGTDMDAFNDIDIKNKSDINETSAATTCLVPPSVVPQLIQQVPVVVSNVINNSSNNVLPLKATVTPNIQTEVVTSSSNDNIKDELSHGNNANVSKTNTTIISNSIGSNNNITTTTAPAIPATPALAIPNQMSSTVSGPGLPPATTNLPFGVTKPISNNKPPAKPFDVTSIVKDTPKVVMPMLSSFSQPPHSLNKNVDDMMGKLATSSYFYGNKEFVSGENDNAKVTTTKMIDTNATNDNIMKLSYKPGQWAPDYQQGEPRYDRDFLLTVKLRPDSNKKPQSLLLDSVSVDDKCRLFPSLSGGGRSNDYIMNQSSSPYVGNYGGGGGKSQRGSLSKRNSQSGKIGGGNSGSRLGSGDKNQANKSMAKVSISLRGEVKLHQVENAWKPSRLNVQSDESVAEDEKETNFLYKQVRSILNKLTPQKFELLLSQFRQLAINTPDRLNGVIDLIFDKATDEPNFSLFYAKMCKEIHFTYPQANTTVEERKNGFRSLLVRRCQTEFEKSSIDENKRNNKVKEIEECTDSDKKKELEYELEEYDTKLRRKSLGTIRFIGELFKQNILTASIMARCLGTLLKNQDEESLECLCKLITTVGPEMDELKMNLEPILNELKMIADNSLANANNNNNNINTNNNSKKGQHQQQAAPTTMKVTSRLRFMIQDVIELRDRRWALRRPDTSPKTMDQIVKDIDNEQHQQHSANLSNNNILSSSSSLRKDVSRGISGSGGGGGSVSRSQRMTNSDGWNSVSSSSSSKKQFIQTDKMRVAMPEKETLGSSEQFGTWVKGAAGGSSSLPKNSQLPYFSNNSYAILENYDPMEKRPPMRSSNRSKDYSSQKDGTNSSSNSIERSNFTRSSGSAPRHHHQQQQPRSQIPSTDIPSISSSQLNSSALRRNNANNNYVEDIAPPSSVVQKATTVPTTNVETEVEISVTLDDNNANNKFDSLHFANGLEEVIDYPETLDAYLDEIKEKYLLLNSSSPVRHSDFVYESLYSIMEKAQPMRLKCGEVLCIYMKNGIINFTDFYIGLEKFRAEINDIKIDVPQVWQFLAEIIAAAVTAEAFPLTSLHIYLTRPPQRKETTTSNGSSEDDVKLADDVDDFALSSMPTIDDIQLVLKTIFDLIVKENNSSFLRNLWQKSGLKLGQFITSEDVVLKFIEKNKLEFLTSCPPSQMNLTYDEIRVNLLELFKKRTATEEIITWISKNVGDQNTTDNKFLRVLATAIYEDSICNGKLLPEILIENSKLIQKYVDYKVDYETQCLFALQSLSQRLEHPKGLLLDFCNTLYDNSILSKDAFINWGKDSDPTSIEGRGVALFQLNSFFTQLRENEDEK